MRPLSLGALALLAASASGQIPAPPSMRTPGPATPYSYYGEPQDLPLTEIVNNPEQYKKANARTTGDLRSLGPNLPYFILADAGARILLLAAEDPHDLQTYVGRRVEVTGVVRVLPEHQATVPCMGQMLPESKCEDPQLPALPDQQPNWPRSSLTVLRLSDAPQIGPRHATPEGLSLFEIITNPGPYAVKPITVLGSFAGRDLFGDLPKGSQRSPSDWVLKQGQYAVWVTGKPPQGKGWKLNPDYRGDASKWLQVTGRVEVVNGVTYLRATNVVLTSAPKADEDR